MLLIHCTDIDTNKKTEITRALPRLSWVQENKDILAEALGAERYMKMMAAVQQGKGQACKETVLYARNESNSDGDDYDFNDHNFDYGYDSDPDGFASDGWSRKQGDDFTACSGSDCGWCGRCDY